MTHADGTLLEQAGIVSLFIVGMTVVVALIARRFGLVLGVRHDVRSTAASAAPADAGPQGIPANQAGGLGR